MAAIVGQVGGLPDLGGGYADADDHCGRLYETKAGEPMAENDDVNNAEAFDEDLLVEEGADDTDISSDYPPDHYEAVLDPGVTEAGQARTETIQERVWREESDPVADELSRNALAKEIEDDAYRRAGTAQGNDEPVEVQLAELDDAAIDNEL